jgi:hypothetical protein
VYQKCNQVAIAINTGKGIAGDIFAGIYFFLLSLPGILQPIRTGKDAG